MSMSRRQLIRNVGAVICAGKVPMFLPNLLPTEITKGLNIGGPEIVCHSSSLYSEHKPPHKMGIYVESGWVSFTSRLENA